MVRLLTAEEFQKEPDGIFFVPVLKGLAYFTSTFDDMYAWEPSFAGRCMASLEYSDGAGLLVKAPMNSYDGKEFVMETVSLAATMVTGNRFASHATPERVELHLSTHGCECSFLVHDREEVVREWTALLTDPLAIPAEPKGNGIPLEEVSRVMEWRREKFVEMRAYYDGEDQGFRSKMFGTVPVSTNATTYTAKLWKQGVEEGRRMAGTRSELPPDPWREAILGAGVEYPEQARMFRRWRDLMGDPTLDEVAQLLGKGKSTVCRYLSGDTVPPKPVRIRCRQLLVEKAKHLSTGIADGAIRYVEAGVDDVAEYRRLAGNSARWPCCRGRWLKRSCGRSPVRSVATKSATASTT